MMDKILLDFNFFQQGILSEEFIQSIWDGGFLDFDVNGVSEDTDDLLNDNFCYVELLLKLRDELVAWAVTASPEETNSFWNTIASTDCLTKQVMATLAFFLDCPKRTNGAVELKDAAILSATIYLTLARLPGSTCVQFFHPVIFQKSFGVLKTLQFVDQKGRKNLSFSNRHGQSSQRNQSGRKRLSSQSSDTFDDNTDELDLTDHDILRLKQRSTVLLQALVMYLKYNSLKAHPHLSEGVLTLLADLTRIDASSFSSDFATNSLVPKITNICHLSYMGILTLCMRNDGPSQEMVKQAFSALRPNLLMFGGPKKDMVFPQTIPREAVNIKDQMLAFVLHIMHPGGDNIKKPLCWLMKSTILSTPDKSEYRTKMALVVLKVLERMSTTLYCEMCKWLFDLSKCKKASGRMLSVEILGPLLTSPDFRRVESFPGMDPELIHYADRTVLLQALLMRCSDKISSVMAKALQVLATCLSCENRIVSCDIKQFITPRVTNRLVRVLTGDIQLSRAPGYARSSGVSSSDRGPLGTVVEGTLGNEVDTIATVSSSVSSSSNFTRYESTSGSQTSAVTAFYLTTGFDITLADSNGLLSLIKRRMKFPKACVRKSAMLTLESMIVYNSCVDMTEELEVLREHCRDVAVPLRKQAIQVLTRLLQMYPSNQAAQMAWLNGVLPTNDDNEVSVQEKCWESVKSVLFDAVCLSQEDASAALAWQLCVKINSSSQVSLHHILHSVCVQLHRKGELPSNIVHVLAALLPTNHSQEAWMLLSIVSSVTATKDKVVANIVADQWLDNKDKLNQSEVLYALKALFALANYIKKDKCEMLMDDLLVRLTSYQVPVSYIEYMVAVLSKLRETVRQDRLWAREIIKHIDSRLSEIVCSDSYDSKAIEVIPTYLITLGALISQDPEAISPQLIQIVQSLVVLPKCKGDERKPGFISDMADGLLPASLRNSALVCLGQICVQNEPVAKQSIPVLAKELETSTNPALNEAIVTILCDLCRLYANAVGPYVSCISSCLKSAESAVRLSTFVNMTRLLQEDFLKWSGSLFYRFIACVVDEDTTVAEMAKQSFIHELSKRNHSMYTQHFVECVFHFNDFTAHQSYNRFPQTKAERSLFTLIGQDKQGMRQKLYNFMLDQMTDTQKFTTTEKLCQDVLSAAVEREIDISTDKGAAVFVDALNILQSKNIKLSVTKASSADVLNDGLEEVTPSQASRAKASVAVVSKLARKTFVETVVPNIISLKPLLEACHSPFIKHLMLFLIEITKDYKSELADILAGNEQLASELAFDIRKFEEMQAVEEAQKQAESIHEEAAEGIAAVNGDVVDRTNIRTPLPGIPGSCRSASNTSVTPRNAAHGTSAPKAVGDTPAMPPPPLKSALRKPMTDRKKLTDSAERIARDQRSPDNSEARMVRRVNFDEEDEEEADVVMPPTPMQPQISGAVGTRAISTPDGSLTDITFANSSSLRVVLSPIDLQAVFTPATSSSVRRDSGRTSKAGVNEDPLSQLWNIKSPLRKSSRHRMGVSKSSIVSTSDASIPLDPLGVVPASKPEQTKSKRVKRKPNNKKK